MIRFPMGNISGLGDNTTLAQRKAYRSKLQERREVGRYFERRHLIARAFIVDAIFEARCTIALLGKEAA